MCDLFFLLFPIIFPIPLSQPDRAQASRIDLFHLRFYDKIIIFYVRWLYANRSPRWRRNAVQSRSQPHFFKIDEFFQTESIQACDSLQSNLNATFRLKFLRPESEYLFDFYYVQALCVLEVPFDKNPKAPEGYKWVQKSNAYKTIVEPTLDAVVKYVKLYK